MIKNTYTLFLTNPFKKIGICQNVDISFLIVSSMNFFSLDRMLILHFHSGIVYFHFSVVTFFHQRQKKGLQIDLIVFFVSMASFQNFMPNHSVSTGFLLKIKPFSIEFRNLFFLSKANKRKTFCFHSFLLFLLIQTFSPVKDPR